MTPGVKVQTDVLKSPAVTKPSYGSRIGRVANGASVHGLWLLKSSTGAGSLGFDQ